MLKTAFIHAATTSRVTAKPNKGFYDLCVEVGRRCLQRVGPMKIQSFYLASMDPALYGLKGEFQASLSDELGMRPKEMLAIRGTSSAGGIGCIPGYKDIASGYHDYSLVISAEQMNRPTTQGRPSRDSMVRERKAVQEMLSGVIDSSEQLYGLSMILIGDMIERALLRYLGISKDQFRSMISDVTMAMYRRAALYPYAHFFANKKTTTDYDESPWVSEHYRRDDVVPISTGACAMVLASAPPPPELGPRVVELCGIGQGLVHPAIAKRFGPVTSSASVRNAIGELMRRSGLSLETLRGVDLAFPHDAFPSISRLILKELGYTHDEAIDGLISGRFNPCGGLVKCGHPVGCSGEMQIVRAFQQMTHDRMTIDEDIQRKPADSAFTVSIGAALTNVIATCLRAYDRDQPPPDAAGGCDPDRLEAYVNLEGGYDRYEQAMGTLPDGCGVVLTSTETRNGEVHLLQLREKKAFAVADGPVEIGALVELRPGSMMELNSVGRTLEAQLSEQQLRAFGIVP